LESSIRLSEERLDVVANDLVVVDIVVLHFVQRPHHFQGFFKHALFGYWIKGRRVMLLVISYNMSH
jgi:hypothetical protein